MLSGSFFDNGPHMEDKIGAQRCKPDYEGMISRNRANAERYAKFISAFYEFIGHESVRDKMAELLGELVSIERRFRMEIENLIKAQEDDKD